MDEKSESLSPDIQEKAYLVVNARIFHLDKEVIKIGRYLENDLVLNDLSISRYHAEIRFEESQFLLVDLNSSGGTYLNNKKITQGVLFSGDIIVFTRTPVMFMNEGASMKNQSMMMTGHLNNQEDTEPNQFR
jgi:pSer/pThr/pTyr-binding forkhead associated (FHA) protein